MKIRGIHVLPFGGNAGKRLTQIRRNGFAVIRMTDKTPKRDSIACSVATSSGTGIPPYARST